MPLTKEQILSAVDIQREVVQIPEWGGEVIVSGVSGAERDDLEQSMIDPGKSQKERMRNFRARLSSMCIVDENGNRLFSESDIETLGKKSAKALDRIVTVAQRLNGLTESDVKEITKK